ncbi:MAG: hypothetical protein KKD68_09865, partial [Proteobacteria bacterium]|nr:hypothetical protein [Pseudomonadota bacterium]
RVPISFSCHCEERSDEAISWFIEWLWDCFVGLWPPRNDKERAFQISNHETVLQRLRLPAAGGSGSDVFFLTQNG